MVEWAHSLPTMLHYLRTLVLLLLVAMGAAEHAPARERWDIVAINGIEYVNLRDVWEFYHFERKTSNRPGYICYGAKNRLVSLRASRQDFYVNNYRYVLSYPVQERSGQLYLSTVDLKKLVDPVLRPRLKHAQQITTIVLDPGHGGHDSGARSPYAREKDCNLALALKVRDLLRRAGYKVVMTRDADFFLRLDERVAIANRTPNSIFVSIHHNSGGSAASGIETFTLAPHGTTSPFARTRRTEELSGNNQDSENIALATAVHSRAVRSTSAIDRGIQRARFSVLCTIRRPAILFEGGFVSHPQEGVKIASDSYQNTLAQSICDGIVSYCRLANKAAGATPRRGSATTTPVRPYRQ